jgi:ribokinase
MTGAGSILSLRLVLPVGLPNVRPDYANPDSAHQSASATQQRQPQPQPQRHQDQSIFYLLRDLHHRQLIDSLEVASGKSSLVLVSIVVSCAPAVPAIDRMASPRCLVRGSISESSNRLPRCLAGRANPSDIDEFFHLPHIVRPGETISSTRLTKKAGGKGANQAYALARAGGGVVLDGCIGDDGIWVRGMLEAVGVDVGRLRVVENEVSDGSGSGGERLVRVAENGLGGGGGCLKIRRWLLAVGLGCTDDWCWCGMVLRDRG